MFNKKQKRLIRANRLRYKLLEKHEGKLRLVFHRTPRHTYTQLVSPDGRVLAGLSTLSKVMKGKCKHSGNEEAATLLGKVFAEHLLAEKLLDGQSIVFDRSGFTYHGRVKAFAEAAREAGLIF